MKPKRINTYYHLEDLAPINAGGTRSKKHRICFYHFIVTDDNENPVTDKTFVSVEAANQFIAEQQ